MASTQSIFTMAPAPHCPAASPAVPIASGSAICMVWISIVYKYTACRHVPVQHAADVVPGRRAALSLQSQWVSHAWADLHGDGGARHRARCVLEQLQVQRADPKAAAPGPLSATDRQTNIMFHELASAHILPTCPQRIQSARCLHSSGMHLSEGQASLHDSCNTRLDICRMQQLHARTASYPHAA